MTSPKQIIDTAVILAAGMGTRLNSIVGDDPKGLLKIDGKQIIKRSLRQLIRNGIEKIILVTGFQNHKYRDLLCDEFPMVQYIQNNDFAITGSMHSLFLARSIIKSDFLLLESDLIYENRAISHLLSLNQPDIILLSGKTGSGDEVYVYGNSGKITLITKKVVNTFPRQGELVGISKISHQLLETMCQYYQKQIQFPSDFHYEDCLSDVSRTKNIAYHQIEDLIWSEIDDAHHYQRALDLIIPRIKNADRCW